MLLSLSQKFFFRHCYDVFIDFCRHFFSLSILEPRYAWSISTYFVILYKLYKLCLSNDLYCHVYQPKEYQYQQQQMLHLFRLIFLFSWFHDYYESIYEYQINDLFRLIVKLFMIVVYRNKINNNSLFFPLKLRIIGIQDSL